LTLVDSNVLIDILGGDPVWAKHSARALAECAARGGIVINDVVYAELSAGFLEQSRLDVELAAMRLTLAPMSKLALFQAGQAFRRYRASGGPRPDVLADFFLGAQASVERWSILTRDSARYRTYFPGVVISGVVGA
jgi:predicted nucleic acid-binding protein